MFQTVELGQAISKDEFHREVPKLRTRLLELQHRLKDGGFSVVVLISGVEGAGKSETVKMLHEWFDPRFLETQGFGRVTEEERSHPPFWRFWNVLPSHGRIGIYFGSWYTEPVIARAFEETSDAELTASMERINAFERALVDDGTLLLKFWFHLAKDVQHKRLKKLEKDPEQSWRVTGKDWKHFKRYDEFKRVSERALGLTGTGHAPWTLVEGTDKRYRYLTVGRHIERELTRALERAEARKSQPGDSEPRVRIRGSIRPEGERPQRTVLETVDLSSSIDKPEYSEKLETLQARFGRLSREFGKEGLAAVFAFEGWDAAGKGGVIRRVAAAIDARHYAIVPVAAPTDEEKAHHYLWRFWRHIPKPGRLTIFDRTWYGRVLVERVEGFASEAEWSRAYGEINEFERQLTEAGIVVNKFWLHMDKDEQYRRFKEREVTPWKQFKLTDDDWRNREKWEAYELAVHDMVERTSTADAPWTLVPSNDKRFARLHVLETICESMEARLSSKRFSDGKSDGRKKSKKD